MSVRKGGIESHIHPANTEEGPLLPTVARLFLSLQPKDSETQITYSVLEQIIQLVIPQGSKKNRPLNNDSWKILRHHTPLIEDSPPVFQSL